MNITKLENLPKDFKELVKASEAEGFNFIRKMDASWVKNENRFTKNGEFFLGIFEKENLVGCGGLNIDPYIEDEKIGRVRHLYIHPNFRRRGLAKDLMLQIEKSAKKRFQILRLRTFNPEASKFYLKLGYEKTAEKYATHYKVL